jgi:hypothetical protein
LRPQCFNGLCHRAARLAGADYNGAARRWWGGQKSGGIFKRQSAPDGYVKQVLQKFSRL